MTGGLGYIGSHTCLSLIERGHEVSILDNLSNADIDVLDKLKKLAKREILFSDADLRDFKSLRPLLKDILPETVVHFAGVKAVAESVEDPLKYYENNVGGTLALLKAMSAADCNRIIFSSSATVYGEPKSLPYTEDHPTEPISPYGESKLFAEKVIRDWTNVGDGRQAISLRYFNPVGADSSGELGENPKGTPNNLMPIILQVASGHRKELAIFGSDYQTRDGTCVRDYIHVSDLASAHVCALDRLMDHHIEGFDVFNIGTGNGLSVLELVTAFQEVTGQAVERRFEDRRPGDLAEYWAQPEKAKKALKWSPTRTAVEICRDAWRWHENQRFTSN